MSYLIDTRKFKLSFGALAIASILGLSGCGGGETEKINADVNSSLDTDGDKLSDEQERAFKTNPLVKDTDGDGYDDYEEIFIKAFDKDTNNFQFNPRIADLPMLEIELTSTPDLAMIYTEGSTTRQTIGTERTIETSTANTNSWGGSNSQSIENTHTASVEVSAEYQFGLFGGATVSGTLGYEYSYSTTNETSTNWSNEQQTENSKALTQIENKETENSVNVEGGAVSTSITIRNNGNIAYVLKDMTLSSFMNNPSDPTKVSPVGNLTFFSAGNSAVFPELTLTPGEKTPPLNFSADVDLATIKSVLKNSSNLVIEPIVGSMGGNGDISFELASTNINARTAQIVIDYGIDRPKESYRIATVVDQNNPGTSAKNAFEDILQLPFTTGTSDWYSGENMTLKQSYKGVIQVRDRAMSADQNGYWIVAHTYTRDSGATKVTDYHNLILDDYDFDNIILKKGHVLHLVYIQDNDRDGLGNRTEHLHGTKPDEKDSDRDGLTDYEEIAGWDINYLGQLRRVTSNPLEIDTDNDGLTDLKEKQGGTHPSAKPLNEPPVVNSVTSSNDGMNVTIEINVSDSNGDAETVNVDWGNGVQENHALNGQASIILSYTGYATLGNFTVAVTAYDSFGEASNRLTQSVYAGIPQDNQLISFNFDNNYTDAKGNTFNLTGLEGYTTDRFGYGQRAIDFGANNGNSGSFPMLYSPTGFTMNTNFTMALWLKLDEGQGGLNGNNVRIAGIGNGFAFHTVGNNVRFGDTNGTSSEGTYAQYGQEPSDQWELYVGMVSFNGSISTISLYRNGVLTDSKTVTGSLSNPTNCRFYVGSYASSDQCSDSMADEFSGLNAAIDDLRVYSRALTAGEIRALYTDR